MTELYIGFGTLSTDELNIGQATTLQLPDTERDGPGAYLHMDLACSWLATQAQQAPARIDHGASGTPRRSAGRSGRSGRHDQLHPD